MPEIARPSERRAEHRRSAFLSCKIFLGEGGPPLLGKIVNVSRGGMLVEANACLLVGSAISVEVYSEEPEFSFRAMGQVVSAVEDGPSSRYSIHVEQMSGGMDEIFDDFLSKLSDFPALTDRRRPDSVLFFPVRRRANDTYVSRYLENPYDHFCRALQEVPRYLDVRTIVISPALDFLGKRIRRALEKPRLITTDELDGGVGEGVALVVNIDCRRRHEPYTFLDFEELVRQRKRTRAEPLQSLVALTQYLAPGQTAAIASLAPYTDRALVQKYLTVAKLTDFQFISDHVVIVKKRAPLLKEVFDGQFILEELQTSKGISDVHSFSKNLYDATNHYDEEVDSLFSLQSDYYRVKNRATGQVITCGRVSWHLPGFPLPMMLAVRPCSDEHIYLNDPDRFSYGEVYAPYMLSVTTGKVFGELIRTVYDYCARGLMDYILTTYQATQAREYRFLSRCVGFKDTKVILRYGTFGGDWSVVYSSKNIFDDNWKVHFASPGDVPMLYQRFKK